MTRCIAVLGATGTGKSTLVAELCQRKRVQGSADTSHELQPAAFTFLDEEWVALDCPGSLEFQQQAMNALLVADIAVIVVSPDPEHSVLAAPYILMAEQAGIPAVLFINRMDEATARARDIVDALQGYSNHPVVLRQIPIREDGAIVGAVDLVSERAWKYREHEPSALIEIPANLLDREAEAREGFLESLSEYDDWLLEALIEDRQPANAQIFEICARVLEDQRLLPAFIGSALHGNGIFRLMKALRHETPRATALSERSGGAIAACFMVQYRKHVGKTAYLRAFGEIPAGTKLGDGPLGPVSVLAPDGHNQATVVSEGQIFSAIKSDHLDVGSVYRPDAAPAPDWFGPLPGLLSQGILAANEREDAKLSEALGKLAEEDISLHLGHDADTGAHVLSGQGAIHIREARARLSEIFGVETEECRIAPALKETITGPADVHYRHKKQSGGAGQFADVKLRVAPVARGEGFRFDQTIHGGSVPKNYIPAVEQGAAEATDRGPLGFPVVDISVTLHDGQHHNVDSSDMAFRIAARAGVRQALTEAGSVLLEPIYAVRFTVPSVFTGGLNPLIAARRGQVLGFDRLKDAAGWDSLNALLPGSALESLIADLRSATQGVGRFDAEFHHYQELYGRDADQMIESRARTLEHA